MKVLIEEISSESNSDQLEELIITIDRASQCSLERLNNSSSNQEYIKQNINNIQQLSNHKDQIVQLEINQLYQLFYCLIYFKLNNQYWNQHNVLINEFYLICLNHLIEMGKIEEFIHYTIRHQLHPNFNQSSDITEDKVSKLHKDKDPKYVNLDTQLWKLEDCRSITYFEWLFTTQDLQNSIDKNAIYSYHLPFVLLLINDYEIEFKFKGLQYFNTIIDELNHQKLIKMGIPLLLNQHFTTFLGFIKESPDLFDHLIRTYMKLIKILKDNNENYLLLTESCVRNVILYSYSTYDSNNPIVTIVLQYLIELIQWDEESLLIDFDKIIQLICDIQSKLKFNQNEIDLKLIQLNHQLIQLVIQSNLPKDDLFKFKLFSSCLSLWFYSVTVTNRSLSQSIELIKSELNQVLDSLFNKYSQDITLFKNDFNEFISHPVIKPRQNEFSWIEEKLNN